MCGLYLLKYFDSLDPIDVCQLDSVRWNGNRLISVVTKRLSLPINSLKSSHDSHDSIALVGVKSTDVAIHHLVRVLIIFVSFTSKFPGIFFLLPAIVDPYFPDTLSILYSYYLSRLFSFYLLAVPLLINPLPRSLLCK